MEEWIDTTTLCKTFNVDGACSMLVDMTPCKTGNFTGGMTGVKHSEETKQLLSDRLAGRVIPSLHKGGKIMKDGVVREFDCLSHICKELNLSTGHLSELMSGKRRIVKGWVRV